MADATAQILAANVAAADQAYAAAIAAVAAGQAAMPALQPAALALLVAAQTTILAVCVDTRVAVQLHETRDNDKSVRKRLEAKTPAERMGGRRFTGAASEANTIHQQWDYLIHNVLPVLELPQDHHRVLAWLGQIFDKGVAEWWNLRVVNHPYVAGVPAQAGPPVVAAIPAVAAGGYATVTAMRDGFLDQFKYEAYPLVAQRLYSGLKCTGHKHFHDFNTKFNQLYPVVRPAMAA